MKQAGIRLTYPIIQQRLNHAHLPVKIKPLVPYRNLSTKVDALYYRENKHKISTVGSLLKRCHASNHFYKRLCKYQQFLDKKFNHNVTFKLITNFHGRRKTQVSITNHKYHITWHGTLESILVSMTGLPPSMGNSHRTRRIIPKRTLKSMHHFLKMYHHQNRIYLPNLKYDMQHYGSKKHISVAYCLLCGYGIYESWHPTFSGLMASNFTCPNCSYKQRGLLYKIPSVKRFYHWYQHQDNIYIPFIKRVLKYMIATNGLHTHIYSICTHCGYGCFHEWLTPAGILMKSKCPHCQAMRVAYHKAEIGLKHLLTLYHAQNDIRLLIPAELNDFVNQYISKVHIYCTHCGYGKYGDWYVTYAQFSHYLKVKHRVCPNEFHAIRLSRALIKRRINHIFNGHVKIIKFMTAKKCPGRKAHVIALDLIHHIKWLTTVDDLLSGSLSEQYRSLKSAHAKRYIGKQHIIHWNKTHPNITIFNLKYVLEHYRNMHQRAYTKCNRCGYGSHHEWHPTLESLVIDDCGCPLDNASLGERLIDTILNYKYHMASVSTRVLKRNQYPLCFKYRYLIHSHHHLLHLDFMLNVHGKYYAIEFDGIQHCQPIDFAHKIKQILNIKPINKHKLIKRVIKVCHIYMRQKQHDKWKDEWTFSHRITMIRIRNSYNVTTASRIKKLIIKTLQHYFGDSMD